MKSIFLVQHVHLLPDGEEDVKLIGAYKTEADAKLAVRRKKRYPGFRESPEGFEITSLELGKDQWSEGFVSLPPIKKPRAKKQK